MAIPKTSHHVRSTSLSSTCHPLDASVENHLHRLSASQAGPSSSSSICRNINSIKDLHSQVNDMIHLTQNQQVLSQELYRGEVEEVLDGSLALIDISSSASDVLIQMKESLLHLQSSLRRGNDSEGVNAYLTSRKKICKAISKHLADKKAEKSCSLTEPENDATTVRMLKEAEAISLSTLKSVLSFVLGKKGISERHGWSLVQILVKPEHASSEAENPTEVEQVDCILLQSVSEKRLGANTKAFLKQPETLKMTIHELEDSMESLSRCFVKTRVSPLSVLNQ